MEKKKKLSKEEKQALKEKKKQERERLKEEQGLKRQIAEETKAREKNKKAEEDAPLEWVYDGKADITIGEVHISNTAKILLIALLVLIIVLGVLGFLNRKVIYDFVVRPSVVLTTEEANIEVGDKFDPNNYLAAQKYAERYELIQPDIKKVDTNKLGTYEVEYQLKTLTGVNSTPLKVNVVDTTAPKISLTKKSLILIRDKDTKNFDANKYIKDYSDNYDKKEDITLSMTETIDWSKDEVEIIYSVKDKSGNIGEAKLPITVNDPPVVPETNSNNGGNSGSQSSNNSSSNSGNSNSGSSNNSSSNNNRGNSNSGNNSSSQKSNSSNKAYISGVHDITVKVDSDFTDMVNKLVSGVEGSGYVTCDYSSVNLQQSGTYTVTFHSDDGVTKTAKVKVVD